jgi:hypothetical protein
MNVEVVYRNDLARPVLDPLPEENGVVFRLIRGDYLDPFFGDWFKPPYPRIVLRARFEFLPFPFFAWKLGSWSGYLGAKVYGVHHPEYVQSLRLHPDDVYEGSTAFCFSIRPFAKPE